MFSYLKVRKNLNTENLGNSFETVVTLISKWPGIGKIYPSIIDYRILCVLKHNLLVFDSTLLIIFFDIGNFGKQTNC